MRRHDRFKQLAPRIDAEIFHRVVGADALAVAHLDTGYSVRIDNHGCLDLVFARDGEIAVIPYVIVQGMHLFVREDSPFVWPVWLPPMRADVARAIEDVLEPWLRSLTIGRFVGGEVIKYFGTDEDAHRFFERARAYGFLGAAPLDDVLSDVAPYVYGLRFAKEKRVGIRDARGANGAAILARSAGVQVELGDPERAAAAARWFGLDVFGSGPDGETLDVAIAQRSALPPAPVLLALDDDARDGERGVRLARPVPIALMVSFDLDDGAEVRRFAASAPPVALRDSLLPPARIVGGSSGRIGLVVRDDYLGVDDADGDAAAALSERLDEQGFTASVVGASHVRPVDFDLLHVFGYRCATPLRSALDRAGNPDIPIVLTPYADDPKNEAPWGSIVHREALSNAIDEAMRDLYSGAIRDRLLIAPQAPPIGALVADPDVQVLFARARAAVVCGEEEELRIRTDFGFRGETRIVPAVLGDEAETSGSIGDLTGAAEFAFLHAPIDPRCNQYTMARACAALGYPVVFVGPVANVEYYGEVLAALGPGGVLLPAGMLSPGDLAALYRRARVFADLSWTGHGLHRVARAAASGAALVGSSSGYARTIWPGLVQIVDPGSYESISIGLRAAWERAPDLGPRTAARTAERCAPFDTLVATLAAYQAAASKQAVP